MVEVKLTLKWFGKTSPSNTTNVDWVGREEATLGKYVVVSRPWVLTQTGRTLWDRATVAWGIANQPIKELQLLARQKLILSELDYAAIKGSISQPNETIQHCSVDTQEWISVPVPATIVDENLFASCSNNLQENQLLELVGKGARYLLQGLVTCKLWLAIPTAKPLVTKRLQESLVTQCVLSMYWYRYLSLWW